MNGSPAPVPGLNVTIAVESTHAEPPAYRQALFPIAAVLALLAFFAAPWSIEVKAHAFLHGLCAQRRSHTFRFGGQPLPFDARMTGIYAAFFTSSVVLIARGAYRQARLPRLWVVAIGLLLVAAMAVDGFNSLFLDLRIRHFYTPSNAMRLMTGAGVGIVLAAAISYLISISLWRRPDLTKRGVDGRSLAMLIAAQIPLIAILAGWPALYLPLMLILLVAAAAVMTLLALVTLVMLLRVDNSFERPADLQVHATAALVLGIAVIALLAGLRFLYERHFGPSPLV